MPKVDRRPARPNYWSRGQLKKNKIKRAFRHNSFGTPKKGMTIEQVREKWMEIRKKRKK